jgi:hypothetical protein
MEDFDVVSLGQLGFNTKVEKDCDIVGTERLLIFCTCSYSLLTDGIHRVVGDSDILS